MARKNATPPRLPNLAPNAKPVGFQPTAPAAPADHALDDKMKRYRLEDGTYVFDQNGQLHCSASEHTPLKGKMPWCKHIETGIRAQVDANWCFDPGQLIVPMFPTHGAYAEVRVDDNVLAGSRQLFIPIRKGGNFTDGLDFVGFISPGEGRLLLRSMLVEWMGNKRALLDCESRLHGVKQERIISSFKDNAGWMAANAWTTITDGLCIPCSKWADLDTDDNMYGLEDL